MTAPFDDYAITRLVNARRGPPHTRFVPPSVNTSEGAETIFAVVHRARRQVGPRRCQPERRGRDEGTPMTPSDAARRAAAERAWRGLRPALAQEAQAALGTEA